MELDELKILLKEQPAKMREIKSSDDIAKLMGSKTKSITGKLKRSLWIEIITCIVFIVPCVAVGILGTYSSLRIYFSIFAVACFLFLIFLFLLLKKTNRYSSADLPVKSNLQQLVNLLKEFIKRYFQLTMAMIPVTLIIAIVLGYNDPRLHNAETENPVFSNLPDLAWKIGIVILYLVIFSRVMYYLTKWYLKKLYGNYLQQLESLIEELEE